MEIQYLNGENLYRSFFSGAQEVIKNRIFLNNINIFPVADGDTGNNLASTMSYIIEEARALKSAKGTMSLIADAALTGARGNSGIIIAQYINGIYVSLEDNEEITVPSFAESVRMAFPHAYNAISNPMEGTIITVIREWAEAVYKQKDIAKTFYELLSPPLVVAFKSLEETTEKLKVLEDANVVDSGAKGFVHFIQGFTEFVRTGKVKDAEISFEDTISSDHQLKEFTDIEYRYCTEGLVKGTDIDLNILRKNLDELGDSLIVAGSKSKARIHIHTNSPDKIFKILRNEGTILQQKVDDIKRQYESIYERKYNIALITDSIADLPIDIIDKYQINVIPLNLMMENTSYLDKITMTPENFYEILVEIEEYPSSAQPSKRVVENALTSLLKYYDEVLVITVAKAQSGTYSLFYSEAQKLKKDGKHIRVIDSFQNSGAEGLLVMKAAELIHSGQPLDNIVEEIENLRNKTKILVSVNTLKYMVKSGRVNKLKGFLGKLINLKPVISLDSTGKGKIESNAFTLNSNTKKIMDIVNRTNKEERITRYAIVHANNPSRAEEYRRRCLQILGKEPEYIMNISTIVGMSAGVGSVAISYMSEGD